MNLTVVYTRLQIDDLLGEEILLFIYSIAFVYSLTYLFFTSFIPKYFEKFSYIPKWQICLVL